MGEDFKMNAIRQTADMVKDRLGGESTGHDWWHIERVRRNALRIGAEEQKADMFVVEISALLHDISDWKFNGGDEEASSREAVEWLKRLGVDANTMERVSRAIGEVSFKGRGVTTVPSTIEGKIVQDADRLDAMGAIGIARAFAFGGRMGREMYDPDEKPQLHETFEQYKKNRGNTINHFHEKLLLLRDLMNTDTARRMSAERHDFMLEFLDRFSREWEGRL